MGAKLEANWLRDELEHSRRSWERKLFGTYATTEIGESPVSDDIARIKERALELLRIGYLEVQRGYVVWPNVVFMLEVSSYRSIAIGNL